MSNGDKEEPLKVKKPTAEYMVVTLKLVKGGRRVTNCTFCGNMAVSTQYRSTQGLVVEICDSCSVRSSAKVVTEEVEDTSNA